MRDAAIMVGVAAMAKISIWLGAIGLVLYLLSLNWSGVAEVIRAWKGRSR